MGAYINTLGGTIDSGESLKVVGAVYGKRMSISLPGQVFLPQITS